MWLVWGGVQRRELKGRVRICHLAASDTDVRTDKWTTETKQKGVIHIYMNLIKGGTNQRWGWGEMDGLWRILRKPPHYME